MPPIKDHPLRYSLANELHARPFPVTSAPCTVVSLAIKQPVDAVKRDREADRAHLVDLLDRHGTAHPQPGATHYSGQIGRHWLKWEQHTEFVTFTAISDRVSARAFDPADFEVFPEDWLKKAPGQRITSIMVRVMERPDDDTIRRRLNEWFVPESLAVSQMVDGAAVSAGDFRIDPAGHVRFAIFASKGTGPQRLGRIVQRLCEIETYKTMSMLGFARVKGMASQLGGLDNRLTELMVEMTGGEAPFEEILPSLLSTSTELEMMAARSAFRFGATGAYEAIVGQRIFVLGEERFQGGQTFADFMMRRYEPAMRTVKSTEQRLQTLSDRAIRASELLRTRVDVEQIRMKTFPAQVFLWPLVTLQIPASLRVFWIWMKMGTSSLNLIALLPISQVSMLPETCKTQVIDKPLPLPGQVVWQPSTPNVFLESQEG